VTDFLLEEEKMSGNLPVSYELVSEEEAIDGQRLMEVRLETPGAIEWLEKHVDGWTDEAFELWNRDEARSCMDVKLGKLMGGR
jgi:hypothetical protein